MAVSNITYSNKVALNENSSVADINKVKADDMNEIKAVVNNNATEISKNSTDIADITPKKYVVESDTTSIDIPVNVSAGEQVKITMIASGDNSNLEHGTIIYFKPDSASNFEYRFIRTSSNLPNSSASAGTPSTLINNIENANRIIGFHLDNVYAYGELKCFLTGINRFSFQSESCYASNASASNCYQQKTNGYINTGTYSTTKIEKITLFTDNSTVKMPAGTTFIVEKF